MKEWIDISRPLVGGMVQWPGDPQLELRRVMAIEAGGESNSSVLSTSVHVGTHIDAPLHFIAGGADVASVPLAVLCGPVTVVHVAESRDVEPADFEQLPPGQLHRVLFRTSNEALWGHAEFVRDFRAISPSAASRLGEIGTRLVGIDYASVDRFDDADCPCHKTLLGAGMAIIENLDLRGIAPGVYEMVALPLRLVGADGSPARVLLRPI
jgi:arylformamidase